MYNTYYLVLFLYYFSGYMDAWNYDKWVMDQEHKQKYYNRPVMKPESLITSPAIIRKTGKSTKAPARNKGWKGSR